MSLLSGCLVADPPTYEEPPPTPPVFDLANANPFIGGVIVVDRRGTNPTRVVNVSVPFRSSDNGDSVIAALHLDWSFEGEGFTEGLAEIAPSTFDDTERTIDLTWRLDHRPPTAGCHTLTLLAAHESNWETETFRPHIIRGRNDTAMATWWVNVDPPEGEPYTLRNCPSRRDPQVPE